MSEEPKKPEGKEEKKDEKPIPVDNLIESKHALRNQKHAVPDIPAHNVMR